MKLVLRKSLEGWGNLQLTCEFAASFQGNQAFENNSTDCRPEQTDSQEIGPKTYKTSCLLESLCGLMLPEEWLLILFPLSHLT